MTLAEPSGTSHRSSALAAAACIGGCATLTYRNAMRWPPSPLHQFNSGLSWHEAGLKGRPRSARCSPIYATPGYTGAYRHLTRILAPWRNDGASQARDDGSSADQKTPAPLPVHVIDPMPACRISPLLEGALCVISPSQMAAHHIVNVDAPKTALAEFTTMRYLAMRYRGLLRGGTMEKLDGWHSAARRSCIYGTKRSARALRHDIEAARNSVLESWTNGQT